MWDRFDEISTKWVKDMFASSEAGIPDLVYHYTDAAGLVGMLNSGKIWATDSRFLNDKSEIKYTQDIAQEMIEKKLQKVKDVHIARLYGNILSRGAHSLNDAFIFSMSSDPDDLSQWRGYAKDGQGFTVGFCGPSIYNVSEPDDARFGFVKVEYTKGRQLKPLQGALAELEAAFREGLELPDANISALSHNAAAWFSWVVANRASANKHKSFRLEREWRVVTKIEKAKAKSPKVRSSGNRLVRYVELDVSEGKTGRLPIKKIGIGPGFLGSEEIYAVESLLKETGYDAKIYSADTPYRRR